MSKAREHRPVDEHAVTVDKLRAHRPVDHLVVPLNDAHEFFNAPQRIDDPGAVAWERWFQKTGVAYRLVGRPRGKFQLYTHRAGGAFGASGWCCGAGDPA